MTDSKYPGSLMTPEAIKHDEKLGIPLYRLDEIYCDHEFNTRIEHANMADSMDLATSIQQNGLIQPIVIRPCGEQPNDPEGYKYCVIAGFRRYQAYRVNQHPVIPAVLVEDQTEMQNRTSNLIENLKRKQLNLLEEAKALIPFMECGMSREEIAKHIGMSPGWVQIRLMINELDPLVQEEFATGVFTTGHVRQLNSLKHNRELQLELAKKIKEARERGEKTSEIDRMLAQRQKPKALVKKQRNKGEMEEMIEHILQTFGQCVATRALAWACGNIPHYEFIQVLRDEAEEAGLRYIPPEFEV